MDLDTILPFRRERDAKSPRAVRHALHLAEITLAYARQSYEW